KGLQHNPGKVTLQALYHHKEHSSWRLQVNQECTPGAICIYSSRRLWVVSVSRRWSVAPLLFGHGVADMAAPTMPRVRSALFFPRLVQRDFLVKSQFLVRLQLLTRF